MSRPTPRVLIVVQKATSTAGRIGRCLVERDYQLDLRGPGLDESLPRSLDDYAAVAVFGGAMSANDDDLPFIRRQLDWLPVVLASGKPLLAVCLGAQLLVRSLGAPVLAHPKGLSEIGYYAVSPTPAGQRIFPKPLYVYHWHSEGLALPRGAELLATGDLFPNQAFRVGRAVYGLQFHSEITPDVVDRWTTSGAAKLARPGAQSREQQLAGARRHDRALEAWLNRFLDIWLQRS